MPAPPIESLEDPRVADYRNVRDSDLREGRDAFLVEGKLGVRQLLGDSLYCARSLFATPRALAGLEDLVASLPTSIPVYVADPALFNEVVGFNLHRGCLAVGERAQGPGLEDLLSRSAGDATWLLLEQLTDPDNVGGVFRNAMAFGVEAVVLCPRCVDPLYRKAIRVSMGGALRVPFARCADWPADLARLGSAGFERIALDPRGETFEIAELASRTPARGRRLLMLGTEGAGLSDEALEAADARVRIGMVPGVDSLNVATASGIALHALAGAGAPIHSPAQRASV